MGRLLDSLRTSVIGQEYRSFARLAASPRSHDVYTVQSSNSLTPVIPSKVLEIYSIYRILVRYMIHDGSSFISSSRATLLLQIKRKEGIMPHMNETQRFTAVLWTNSLVSGDPLGELEITAARVRKALGDGSLETQRGGVICLPSGR